MTDYGLKTLVQTLINYDEPAAACSLKTAGFYGDKDELAAIDATQTKGTWEKVALRNSTETLREQFGKSKWNEFSSNLNVDMLCTNREWPNSVDLQLSITRKPDNYFIMADTGVNDQLRYEIKDLELHVRKIQPNQGVVEANNAAMARSGAKYQFSRWQQATMHLGRGDRIFKSLTLFRGSIPSKTIYMFIDEEAHSGSYKKNPTLFKHWNIESFTQLIDGVASPTRPLRYEWDGGNYANSYSLTMDGIGLTGLNQGNMLRHDIFKQTRFMIVYDNSADGSSFYDSGRDKISTGTISVDFTFARDLPTSVQLVSYGITNDVVVFDEWRKLYLNPVE
jgi:hypothetical protein